MENNMTYALLYYIIFYTTSYPILLLLQLYNQFFNTVQFMVSPQSTNLHTSLNM